MTLRWKLALALALLSATATGVCATVAYVTTDHRLSTEVNQSLQQAATQLTSGANTPSVGGAASFGPFGGGASSPPRATGSAGTPPPRATRPPPPIPRGVLGLVVIQQLGPAGRVVSTSGSIQLPVTAHDQSLAKSGGAPWIRTAEVDGSPYRIETIPIPQGGAFQLARDLSENVGLLGSLRWIFVVVGLFITLIAAIAGWVIAGRITRRLAALTTSAEEIAATGKLHLETNTSGKDEAGRLARAFTLMLSALSQSRNQQRMLAQNAGHELRTPLTSMRTNIDLLRRHPDLGDTAKEAVLEDLDGELHELTALVNELVELASEHLDMGPAGEVHLDGIAEHVAERLRSHTGHRIALDAEPSIVHGHGRDLERAMSNLVENAIKFSPDGSTIELIVRPDRVEVRDRGIGVSESDLPYLFDRFYRASAARSAPGSGLGLAIVRHVAEMHGGNVFAHRREGGGSCIGFTLPEADHAAA